MQIYQIVLSAVYILALVSYFFIETRDKFTARVVVKVFLATTYLTIAAINFFDTAEVALDKFKLLVLIGCFFAWFGDVFLLFKKYFGVGVGFFMIANLCMLASCFVAVVEYASFAQVWWSILVFVAVFGFFIISQLTKMITLGKFKVLLNCYIAVMTVCGSLGIALACSGAGVTMTLFGIGIALFMVSDYFLGAYMFFKKVSPALVTNSATYFIGLLLIALSLAF